MGKLFFKSERPRTANDWPRSDKDKVVRGWREPETKRSKQRAGTCEQLYRKSEDNIVRTGLWSPRTPNVTSEFRTEHA